MIIRFSKKKRFCSNSNYNYFKFDDNVIMDLKVLSFLNLKSDYVFKGIRAYPNLNNRFKCIKFFFKKKTHDNVKCLF